MLIESPLWFCLFFQGGRQEARGEEPHEIKQASPLILFSHFEKHVEKTLSSMFRQKKNERHPKGKADVQTLIILCLDLKGGDPGSILKWRKVTAKLSMASKLQKVLQQNKKNPKPAAEKTIVILFSLCMVRGKTKTSWIFPFCLQRYWFPEKWQFP